MTGRIKKLFIRIFKWSNKKYKSPIIFCIFRLNEKLKKRKKRKKKNSSSFNIEVQEYNRGIIKSLNRGWIEVDP